jgi:hypothetical protein
MLISGAGTIWFTTEKGWSGQGLVIESTLPSSPHLQSNFQQLHIDGRLSFVALGTGHLFVHSLNSERFMQLVDVRFVVCAQSANDLRILPRLSDHSS